MIEYPVTYRDNNDDDYTINDQQYRSLLVAPYYFIKLDAVDGLWGADISHESHPIPGLTGEVSGDIFRRGKTITLSGIIYARGLAELRLGQRYLQEMFWDVSAPRKLIYRTWDMSEQVYIYCRVIQDVAMTERIDGFTFRAPWTVALRADDPRSRKLSDDTIYPTYQT
jgi:hypothetical protein